MFISTFGLPSPTGRTCSISAASSLTRRGRAAWSGSTARPARTRPRTASRWRPRPPRPRRRTEFAYRATSRREGDLKVEPFFPFTASLQSSSSSHRVMGGRGGDFKGQLFQGTLRVCTRPGYYFFGRVKPRRRTNAVNSAQVVPFGSRPEMD